MVLGKLGRITVMNLKNRAYKDRLLETFSQGKRQPPAYATALDDPRLQKKFAYSLERTAHVWRKQILEEYMHNVPKKLDELQQLQSDDSAELDRLKKRQEKSRRLAERKRHEEERIRELGSLLASGSTKDLQRIGATQKKEDDARQRQSAADLLECEKRKRSRQRTYEKAKNATEFVERSIKHLEKKIGDLSNGSTDITLLSKSFEGIVNLSVYTPTNNQLQEYDRAVGEPRVRPLGDLGKHEHEREIHIPTYQGVLGPYPFYVDKDYVIVPEDREKFRLGQRTEDFFGKTLVTLTGNKFSIEARKAHPGGRQAAYQFKFHFDGQKPMPSVKAVHKVPNIDYNEASISNTEDDLATTKKDARIVRKTLESSQADLTNVINECEDANNTLQEAEERALVEDGQRLLTESQERLRNLTEEEMEVENATEAELIRESELSDRLVELRQQVKAKVLAKRHLAFVIHRRFHTARMIMELTDVTNSSLSSKRVDKGKVVHEIDLFREIYKEAEKRNIIDAAETEWNAFLEEVLSDSCDAKSASDNGDSCVL